MGSSSASPWASGAWGAPGSFGFLVSFTNCPVFGSRALPSFGGSPAGPASGSGEETMLS